MSGAEQKRKPIAQAESYIRTSTKRGGEKMFRMAEMHGVDKSATEGDTVVYPPAPYSRELRKFRLRGLDKRRLLSSASSDTEHTSAPLVTSLW